ncbi:MAG: PLP-dependent aminotransferase family protein [Clostridiales Family XIII bacterium]|nr:PLP-dependent aminotransferase family protein [Clostridiales Family XIII bacterium]
MRYAKRAGTLKPDEIREMIKITSNPKVINFAGGLPAPELFPVAEMARATGIALTESGAVGLQYHATDGYLPLREKISERLARLSGVNADPADIMITNGSQQGIDLSGRLFVDEGDIVLTESPTYSGVFNALKVYLPEFVGVPTDDDGVVPEAFEEILKRYGERIKLMYVIPDYQNPSGRVWSVPRRAAFLELAARYELPVVEDSPYRELCFEGEPRPTLFSMDKSGMVVHLGSFSKILAPGYRVSYVLAERSILDKYIYASQGAFLQASTENQVAIDKYLELCDFDAHIEKIRTVYKRRCELMISLMEKEFPESVTFTRPKGGMFALVTLPEGKNARDLLKTALAEDVAFVVGDAFYAAEGVVNTFRVCYANMPEERIEEGMRRLGKAIRAFAAK